MDVRIAPSILSGDFANLGKTVQDLERAGADLIHIDVMDGRFVPNLTLGPPVIAALRSYTDLPFDVHLMIAEPERSLHAYADAGASSITVHVEACTHLQRTLAAIHESGAQAGLAFNPGTPVGALDYVLDDVDLILIMTVNPGFGGQSFLPAMLHKITTVKEKLDRHGKSAIAIEVDGGIHKETAALVKAAGASVLVAGSYVFAAPTLAEGIRNLREK